MALILNFPIHNTSMPQKAVAREEQILINFPVKSSISDRHPDLDEQIFEMELERVRAKCDLKLQEGKAEKDISMRYRLISSLGKSWRFFVSKTPR